MLLLAGFVCCFYRLGIVLLVLFGGSVGWLFVVFGFCWLFYCVDFVLGALGVLNLVSFCDAVVGWCV